MCSRTKLPNAVLPYSIDDGAKELPPYVNPDKVIACLIESFARTPGLLHELLDLAARKEFADKISPFFHYLFVGSSRPALGADHEIVGYRLRDANERDFVDGTSDCNLSDFDGHRLSPEIEITPEMIKAATPLLLNYHRDSDEYDAEEMVAMIFRAMASHAGGCVQRHAAEEL